MESSPKLNETMDLVEDSDKDSLPASPPPLCGLSMLWNGQPSPLDSTQDCDEYMSPIIPTLNIPSIRQQSNKDNDKKHTLRDDSEHSTVMGSDEESEILIPVNTSGMNMYRKMQFNCKTNEESTLKANSNSHLDAEDLVPETGLKSNEGSNKQVENDSDDDATVDSHTTMGSNAREDRADNQNIKNVEVTVGKFGLDCSDNEEDVKFKTRDKSHSVVSVKLLQDGKGNSNDKNNSDIKENKGNNLKNQDQPTKCGDMEDYTQASPSQSLIDPRKKTLGIAKKRMVREREALSQEKSDSLSSRSSKSSEVDTRGKEEALRNHHSLEMDLMDKLEKHQASAQGLLQRGSNAFVGQVRHLLLSLAPLMDQLRTAHGHERKHVHSARGKKLNAQHAKLLKLQVGLLIEREKRLVHLSLEHNRITKFVKELKGSERVESERHSDLRGNTCSQPANSHRFKRSANQEKRVCQKPACKNFKPAIVAKATPVSTAAVRKRRDFGDDGKPKCPNTANDFNNPKNMNDEKTREKGKRVNALNMDNPSPKRLKKGPSNFDPLDQKKENKFTKKELMMDMVNKTKANDQAEVHNDSGSELSFADPHAGDSSSNLSIDQTGYNSPSIELVNSEKGSFMACSDDEITGTTEISKLKDYKDEKETLVVHNRDSQEKQQTCMKSKERNESKDRNEVITARTVFLPTVRSTPVTASGTTLATKPTTIYIVNKPGSLIPLGTSLAWKSKSGIPTSAGQNIASLGFTRTANYTSSSTEPEAGVAQESATKKSQVSIVKTDGSRTSQHLPTYNHEQSLVQQSNVMNSQTSLLEEALLSRGSNKKIGPNQKQNINIPYATLQSPRSFVPNDTAGYEKALVNMGSPDSSVYGSVILPSNNSIKAAYQINACQNFSQARTPVIKVSQVHQPSFKKDSKRVGTNQVYPQLAVSGSRQPTSGNTNYTTRGLSDGNRTLSANVCPVQNIQTQNRMEGFQSMDTFGRARNIQPPVFITEQKVNQQQTRKLPVLFPDVVDLLKAKVIHPGERLLSMEVQGRTCTASLTEEGWVRGEGGEIFRTPMTWYKALNPESHKLVITKKVAYPKVLYKGIPLSKFELPTTVTVLEDDYIRRAADTGQLFSNRNEPTEQDSFLGALLKGCKVALHSDEELTPNHLLLPQNFWDIFSWKNIRIPEELVKEIDVW